MIGKRTSGGYITSAAPSRPPVRDQRFQDQLLEELAGFTATRLARLRHALGLNRRSHP